MNLKPLRLQAVKKLLLYFWEAVQERHYWNEVSLVENLQSKNEQFIKNYKTAKTQIKQKRG